MVIMLTSQAVGCVLLVAAASSAGGIAGAWTFNHFWAAEGLAGPMGPQGPAGPPGPPSQTVASEHAGTPSQAPTPQEHQEQLDDQPTTQASMKNANDGERSELRQCQQTGSVSASVNQVCLKVVMDDLHGDGISQAMDLAFDEGEWELGDVVTAGDERVVMGGPAAVGLEDEDGASVVVDAQSSATVAIVESGLHAG